MCPFRVTRLSLSYGYAGAGSTPQQPSISAALGFTPAQAAEAIKRFPVGGRAGSM